MSRRALALAALLGLAGCGYRLAHAPIDPAGPFHVVGGRAYAPESAAMAAAEEGARAELARAGQLASGGGGAAIEVEVLRVDEESEGVALGAAGAVLAGAVRVTVTGRARALDRDTGDVRLSEVAARAGGPAQGVLARDEAARVAARRLGERLVRRLLGLAEPASP